MLRYLLTYLEERREEGLDQIYSAVTKQVSISFICDSVRDLCEIKNMQPWLCPQVWCEWKHAKLCPQYSPSHKFGELPICSWIWQERNILVSMNRPPYYIIWNACLHAFHACLPYLHTIHACKVATDYSIYTQLLSWCSIWLVPDVPTTSEGWRLG